MPVTAPANGPPRPPVPVPVPDQKDHAQAAAEARGQASMPGLTWRNSACRDRAGNDLPQFVGGSRLSNTEIARRLYVSHATVKTHINRIFAKTGARDRAQAVRYAYQHGLATPAQ